MMATRGPETTTPRRDPMEVLYTAEATGDHAPAAGSDT